jgi:hypothetical protein
MGLFIRFCARALRTLETAARPPLPDAGNGFAALDRQPPHRARNADRTDDLAAEIAHRHSGAAHLAVELAVVECDAGGAHLVDFLAQPLRLGDGVGRQRANPPIAREPLQGSTPCCLPQPMSS